MKRKWTKHDLIKIFEYLIEHDSPLTTRREFRGKLTRDQNLFANQVTRKATNNLAYKSVDFDIDNISDEEFWARIEGSKFIDLVEDNAAASILGMAEKLGVLN